MKREFRQFEKEIEQELEEKEEQIAEIYNKISRQKEKCDFCRKNYNINMDEGILIYLSFLAGARKELAHVYVR